jgi:hypothetical protein
MAPQLEKMVDQEVVVLLLTQPEIHPVSLVPVLLVKDIRAAME